MLLADVAMSWQFIATFIGLVFVIESCTALWERYKLKKAIWKHYNQHADDKCWMDDEELYAAMGLAPKDHTVGCTEQMMLNCKRYINNSCIPGGGWKSYAELEDENKRLRHQIVDLGAAPFV